MIGCETARLFRSHIAERSDDQPRLGNQRGLRVQSRRTKALCDFGETEVQNLRLALFRKKNILRLKIAMHDSSRMRRTDASENLQGDFENLSNGQTALKEAFPERFTFEQFRNSKRDPLIGIKIMNH